VPPPRGPFTWMHKSLRGLLAVSLNATDSPNLRGRRPYADGFQHLKFGPLCMLPLYTWRINLARPVYMRRQSGSVSGM
jgi:hypothetical protein